MDRLETVLLPGHVNSEKKIKNPIEYLKEAIIVNSWMKIVELIKSYNIQFESILVDIIRLTSECFTRVGYEMKFIMGFVDDGIEDGVRMPMILYDGKLLCLCIYTKVLETLILSSEMVFDRPHYVDDGVIDEVFDNKRYSDFCNSDICKDIQSIIQIGENICQGYMCVKYGKYKCGKCLKARYCSDKCQRSSWKKHKDMCSR